MLNPLVLASLHHVLAFVLFAALAAEFVQLRPGVGARDMRRLLTTDAIYGVTFLSLLTFGVLRVYFGESGPHYYLQNTVFWSKMAVFALIAALSIWPTITFFRWVFALRRDAAFRPPDATVRTVRRVIVAEAALFGLIPILAAMLARGYGT